MTELARVNLATQGHTVSELAKRWHLSPKHDLQLVAAARKNKAQGFERLPLLLSCDVARFGRSNRDWHSLRPQVSGTR